jgi:putative transposase
MPVFLETADYDVFLSFLRQAIDHHLVSVHAYVLMTNHFHMIATPAHERSLPGAMQQLGTNYARFFNRKYERVGTLWNGRYRCLRIENELYWLTCLRYIEQNPVRAGVTNSADGYRWSSHGAHAFGAWPSWLVEHAAYTALGSTTESRQRAYRGLCGTPLSTHEVVVARQPSYAIQ